MPLRAHHHLYHERNLLAHFILGVRHRFVRRRLRNRAGKGLTATVEDIETRFHRLDVHESGALDETKTQLLISWAFDIDLKPDDWDSIYHHLVDPTTGLANKQAIMDWTNSILVQKSEPSNAFKRRLHDSTTTMRAQLKQMSNRRFIIHHKGTFNHLWRAVHFTTLLYMFLSVPYQLSLLRYGLLENYFTSLLISWCFDAILILEMLFKFNRSYEDERSIEVSSSVFHNPGWDDALRAVN